MCSNGFRSNNKFIFLPFLFFVLSYGCTQSKAISPDNSYTKIVSFVDPEYKGNLNIKKITVNVLSKDLFRKTTFENYLANQLRGKDNEAIEDVNLFSPTRDFTDQEKLNILMDNKVQASLVIFPGESGIEKYYVPTYASLTFNHGSFSMSPWGKLQFDNQSNSMTLGGYEIKKPWMDIDVRLIDNNTGKTVWIASTKTFGNGYANFDDLINKFSEQILLQLEQDNLIIDYRRIKVNKRISKMNSLRQQAENERIKIENERIKLKNDQTKLVPIINYNGKCNIYTKIKHYIGVTPISIRKKDNLIEAITVYDPKAQIKQLIKVSEIDSLKVSK